LAGMGRMECCLWIDAEKQRSVNTRQRTFVVRRALTLPDASYKIVEL